MTNNAIAGSEKRRKQIKSRLIFLKYALQAFDIKQGERNEKNICFIFFILNSNKSFRNAAFNLNIKSLVLFFK